MDKIALENISEAGHDEWFDTGWWFEPFGLDRPAVLAKLREVLPQSLDARSLPPVSRKCYPLADGEPEGTLLLWPGPRCGLAMLVSLGGDRQQLVSIWPFTSDGSTYRMEIDRVRLAPDRLQAIITGAIGNELVIEWHDINFAMNRSFYVKGSVHEVALAGIAHSVRFGAPPPLEFALDHPLHAHLLDLQPETAITPSGTIPLVMDQMASIMPIDDETPTLYSISGPVVAVEPYTGQLFGRTAWMVDVIVARIGVGTEEDVTLSVLFTDKVLGSHTPPVPGGYLSAAIRLQGRIWLPNVT